MESWKISKKKRKNWIYREKISGFQRQGMCEMDEGGQKIQTSSDQISKSMGLHRVGHDWHDLAASV